MVQTLDNLRRDGTLSIIEYLERMPDKLITRKQELIDSLKKRMGGTSSVIPDGLPPSPPGKAFSVKGGEDSAFVIGSELDAAKKIAQLPTSMQARYNDLPKTAQRALVRS